ncbi:retrovirus-related pol polyprotein from transposon TNT 1-94, partial [Tanacetum coccineum]
GNANSRQGKPIKCYNYNGIGHIARNCNQPKRPQNFDYFKEKMLLMQAQENEVDLDEEQLSFLAADQCDAFDSDIDEALTAQTMFMANLSSADPVYDKASPSYDSDTLSEDLQGFTIEERRFCIRFSSLSAQLWDLQSELLIERYKFLKSAAEKLKLVLKRSKGDMKVEAKSSSSGSCGKFIEVVIMLILIGSYYCFIHGYYCSTTVNTARTKLMLLHRMLLFIVTTAWYRLLLLVIFSAALHGWYYMVFVTTVGEEYDKVFNHLDMLNAPLEGKGFTCAKQVKPYYYC